MKNTIRIILMSFVLIGLAGAMQDADAQIVKRLKERAKRRVEQNVGQKTDKAIDKAFSAEGQAAENQGETAAPGTTLSAEAAAALKPGEGAWANYDFVPGERALFVDDFSSENVGDFPRRLEFVEGNLEVVEWQGRRFLRASTYPAKFNIVLDEPLPERFTLEFDIAPLATGWHQEVFVSDPEQGRWASLRPGVYAAGLDANGGEGGESISDLDGALDGQVFTFRVTADGSYVKVYQNEHRVANVPNANLGRSNKIYFVLAASTEQPVLISNIRVMAGGADLYDALSAEGRVATQGILFATGSDVIRPESTPTLKEIGRMLTEHPELRLSIEGHTDNTGSAETNQQLSEKRATAVKAFLVATYGIDVARLETQGFGLSKPVADNTTPEGRQQNRRVELMKL